MQQLIAKSGWPGDLKPEFANPPKVHWLTLMAALWAWKILVKIYAPNQYAVLLDSLAADAWAFYLCRWIASLDDDAKSPFWCDIAVVVQLTCAGFTVATKPGIVLESIVAALGFASAILAIVTIYKIRDDLEAHYNGREPYGMDLNGLMTFFFSFLYFQAKLYPIAKAKEEAVAQGLAMSGKAIE